MAVTGRAATHMTPGVNAAILCSVFPPVKEICAALPARVDA